MKPANNPRPLVLLMIILVAVALLTGTLRVFRNAHATVAYPVKARINNLAALIKLTPTPVPTEVDTDLPLQSTPTEIPVSADTTGIIALAIVIVATILVGATWGARSSPQNKKTSR